MSNHERAFTEPTVRKLNRWAPDAKELEAYLTEVRGLLADVSDKVAENLKEVDEAYWEKFPVSSGREMDVLRCYRK